MRVISIGMDRTIFDTKSPASHRMLDYGTIFDELHIIIFTKLELGYGNTQIAKNVFLYPTNSRNRLYYIFDAIRIGKQLLSSVFFGETIISSTDPSETGLVGWILKKYSGFPLQVQIHTDIFSPYFYNHSLLNLARYLLAPFVLKRANSIRVVSQHIVDSLNSKKIKSLVKPQILPIFVDIEKIRKDPISVSLKLKYKEFEKIIVMASRLEPEKDIVAGLKAFAVVLKKFPKTGLVIVGKGSQSNHLRKKTLSLGINNSVIFEDWQQNIVSYFKTCDVFLNTSIFEGYGMTLIEAAASGCPVVTTRVGVAFDFFRDGKNSFVSDVGDVKTIANKIITLFENPLISNQMVSQMNSDLDDIYLTKEKYLEMYRKSVESAVRK